MTLGGSHMAMVEKVALEGNEREMFLDVKREPLRCLESD